LASSQIAGECPEPTLGAGMLLHELAYARSHRFEVLNRPHAALVPSQGPQVALAYASNLRRK
jgi:hypothetical protein